jgi:extracellular factor (EF) 3-hydroxypalmitic acid methyl ester biosynthesis protein
MLLERAEQARFSRDDVILVEGSQGVGICLIRKGYVRVERAHQGHGVAIARRGPGEVVGELSYLQRSGTTASVVADDEVEVAIVGAEDIDALVAAAPGVAERFYQSLAVTVSERLSELTAALPPLVVKVLRWSAHSASSGVDVQARPSCQLPCSTRSRRSRRPCSRWIAV